MRLALASQMSWTLYEVEFIRNINLIALYFCTADDSLLNKTICIYLFI